MTLKKIPGITSFLQLRPEIKSLVERGELRSIQEFGPSPSLANVVLYYEYSELCSQKDGLPEDIKKKCDLVEDIAKKLQMFVNPEEQFERTYLSENMDDLIMKVFAGLLGVSEVERRDGTVTTLRSRIIILPSLLGGGKTHLLITLLHLVKLYNKFVVNNNDIEGFKSAVEKLDPDLARRLIEVVKGAERKRIRLVAIDGTSEETAPDPYKEEPVKKAMIVYSSGIREVKTYSVRTLWGAIAHYIGEYALMSKRDESNSIPSREELENILKGDPVLIMVDEPLVYASRYGDLEKLRDFFQVLAMAIRETNNGILLLSLPVSQEELMEGGVSGVAREIYEVLARTQPGLEIVPPLKAPEIVHVLKKRLFENDEEELRSTGKEIARLVVSKGGDVVRSAIISVYGSVSDFERKVEESYPFSPMYLELLEDFVNYLKYLQRTRDSIRLTIMALAAILNKAYRRLAGDFYFISPYHLPVYDSSIRSYLVNPNYSDYQVLMSMYDKDVEEASKKTSRSELSQVIATYIWLRTIIGRGIPDRTHLRLYPTVNEITLAVYDPAVFSQQNMGPGIVKDLLDELYSYSSYMIALEQRYFMTQLLPIDELINRRIREISDIQAQKRLSELVNEIFQPIRRRGRRSEVLARVFKEVHIVNVENKELLLSTLERGEDPVLIVFAYEPDEGEIGNFITRNNIVAVIPSMKTEIDDPERGRIAGEELIKSLVKELIALETIQIDELKKLYGDEFAEAKGQQINQRAKEVRKKISQTLLNQLYNRIIVGKSKWSVKRHLGSVLSATDDSAVKAVEEILVEDSYIPPRYSYTKDEIIVLAKNLDKTSVIPEAGGLEVISQEIEIEEMWKWLLTTLEPPFRYVVIDFSSFLNGIKELFEDLNIAIAYGDKFIWKQVHSSKPIQPEDRGDWDEVVNLTRKLNINPKSLKIVPWINVLDSFINKLKQLEGLKTEDGVKKYVKVMVSYTDVFGNRVDEELSTFLQRDGWKEIARTAVFWTSVEYPEYAFTLEIESITVANSNIKADQAIKVEPDQEITIHVSVDAEDYPFNIDLTAKLNGKTIESKTLSGDKKELLDIKFKPTEPGEQTVTIIAKGKDPKRFTAKKDLIVRVIGEIGERLTLDTNGMRKLLADANYSRIILKTLEISEMSKIIDAVRSLKDIKVKDVDITNLTLRSLHAQGTLLSINSGQFELYDDLRAFLEPLSRRFKFETGLIKFNFENFDNKEDIERILSIIESLGIKSAKYHIEAYRRVG